MIISFIVIMMFSTLRMLMPVAMLNFNLNCAMRKSPKTDGLGDNSNSGIGCVGECLLPEISKRRVEYVAKLCDIINWDNVAARYNAAIF